MPSQPHITSFWNGPDPVPLPSRFARIKRALVAGHEDAVEASWARLLEALRADVEHIDMLGAHLVPSIEFGDLDAAQGPSATAERFRADLRRYGVGVVRKVVSRREAEEAMGDTMRYVQEKQRQQHGGGVEGAAAPSEAIDPACYNLFWTPAQVRMRAHHNVRRAQRFMMSLWDTPPDGQVAAQHPIAYADRIRVYGANEETASQKHQHQHPQQGYYQDHQPQQEYNHVSRNGSHRTIPTPQSTEDWITALQSSSGIISQVDNGSLERWEPDGYGAGSSSAPGGDSGGGTYAPVFRGRWEEHDPWASARRVPATTDLYNGHGACSVFRMFQGVLALSVVEPGMLRLLPSPRAATAYYLLRPFFAPLHPLPDGLENLAPARQEQEWRRYLDPGNWRLMREPDSVIHGAVPGHAQRVTERWHPHLLLRSSMITLPTLQPGDYILWHPDLPYHISSGASAFGGVFSSATSSSPLRDLRMLVYVPAVPLTQTSALYLARQRKAFRRGQPGPDFDSSSGRGQVLEDQDADADAAEKEMERVGGRDALRAMGLVPWEDGHGTGDGKGQGVVKLANTILFPELSL